MKSNLVLHSVLYRTSCLGAFPHLISNKLSINRGIQDCVECLSPQIVIFILDYVFDLRFGFTLILTKDKYAGNFIKDEIVVA